MADYDASTYGERIADVYDRWARVPQNAEAVVAFLAAAAGKGRVLELGIGTGRIALPLRRARARGPRDRRLTRHGREAPGQARG